MHLLQTVLPGINAMLIIAAAWIIDRTRLNRNYELRLNTLAHRYTREALEYALYKDHSKPCFLKRCDVPNDVTALHPGHGCWINATAGVWLDRTSQKLALDPTALTVSATWSKNTPVLLYCDVIYDPTIYALYFGDQYGLRDNHGVPTDKHTLHVTSLGSVSDIPLQHAYGAR